jgi:mono/diheme cytochrome c family protein
MRKLESMTRTRWKILTAALLLGCASYATAGGAPAPRVAKASTQDSIRSTLTGVYTDSQAIAGKDAYVGRCLSCHAGEHASPVFRRKWAGKMLKEMWALIRETMPDGEPGSLSDEQYSDVVAYILKLNSMPAGATPLPADSLALKKIRLDTLTKQ